MLQRQLGLKLPGTLVFDYPTPAAIAALASRLLVDTSRKESSEGVLWPPTRMSLNMAAVQSQDRAAVVFHGLAARFAGTASDAAGGLLAVELSDAVGPVPCERWDADAQQSKVRAQLQTSALSYCRTAP